MYSNLISSFLTGYCGVDICGNLAQREHHLIVDFEGPDGEGYIVQKVAFSLFAR
jgi:hypothetical protein